VNCGLTPEPRQSPRNAWEREMRVPCPDHRDATGRADLRRPLRRSFIEAGSSCRRASSGGRTRSSSRAATTTGSTSQSSTAGSPVRHIGGSGPGTRRQSWNSRRHRFSRRAMDSIAGTQQALKAATVGSFQRDVWEGDGHPGIPLPTGNLGKFPPRGFHPQSQVRLPAN